MVYLAASIKREPAYSLDSSEELVNDTVQKKQKVPGRLLQGERGKPSGKEERDFSKPKKLSSQYEPSAWYD